MPGKTLINTEIRNEVLGFLQEIAQTSSVPNQAMKAGDLYNQMKPKFVKKQKVVGLSLEEAVDIFAPQLND